MYLSPGHAVWAMVRYMERQRSPQAAPWPDRPVEAASRADRSRYLAVRGTRPHPGGVVHDDDKDPETVLVLFARFDRRRALTRLYILGESITTFRRGNERRRARKAKEGFTRELCHRGLLLNPWSDCPRHARGKDCPRAHGCRPDEDFPLTNR